MVSPGHFMKWRHPPVIYGVYSSLTILYLIVFLMGKFLWLLSGLVWGLILLNESHLAIKLATHVHPHVVLECDYYQKLYLNCVAIFILQNGIAQLIVGEYFYLLR